MPGLDNKNEDKVKDKRVYALGWQFLEMNGIKPGDNVTEALATSVGALYERIANVELEMMKLKKTE